MRKLSSLQIEKAKQELFLTGKNQFYYMKSKLNGVEI